MAFLRGGQILLVDLTTREVSTRPTADYANAYLGGRAVDARLIYDLVGADADPLGPDNVIVFGTGPLTATPFPGSSRLDIMARSPVTGLLGNANVGGDWAAELKFAGYDHVVLRGRVSSLVYLWIHNDVVELRDAGALRGMTTSQTPAAIRAELDNPEIKVISIGPAGENLVTYATIHCSVGNAAARTGMGAVLGSKNVKALAVRGTRGVPIADPAPFLEACIAAHECLKAHADYADTHKDGVTTGEYAFVLSGSEAGGDGHAGVDFDPAGRTDFAAFWRRHGYKRTGCMGCPVHCMENLSVQGLGGTVVSCELYPQLSWEIRNDDMLLWYEMTRACQELGVDSTSMAISLQWLMELHAAGILDAELTDGVSMVWGEPTAIRWMLGRTVRREGFGDVLAQGMRAAAEHLDARIPAERRGHSSTYALAMQVNNNPMYGISPRLSSMALAYSVGRRSDLIQELDIPQINMVSYPADPVMTDEEKAAAIEHEVARVVALTGEPLAGDPDSLDGKAEIVHDMGLATGISDIAGSCKWHTKWFLDLEPRQYADALSAGLGRQVTAEELRQASLRMRNVERAFECRLGRRRANDTIPRKEFGKPISRGTSAGKYGVTEAQLEQLKDEYYALRGWDRATGVPTRETLMASGLADVAADLDRLGIQPGSSVARAADGG